MLGTFDLIDFILSQWSQKSTLLPCVFFLINLPAEALFVLDESFIWTYFFKQIVVVRGGNPKIWWCIFTGKKTRALRYHPWKYLIITVHFCTDKPTNHNNTILVVSFPYLWNRNTIILWKDKTLLNGYCKLLKENASWWEGTDFGW